MLYEIQPIDPARRLATQQVRYEQTEKIYHGGANCSQTHNIIFLLAPDEMSVHSLVKNNSLSRTDIAMWP